MRCVRATAVTIGLLMTGACMVTPVDGSLLRSPGEVVHFSGLAATPTSVVVVEALNQATGKYELIGTATVSPDVFIKGPWDLYPWRLSASISLRREAKTLCRWSPSCTIGTGEHVAMIRARVVVPGDGQRLLPIFESTTEACVAAAATESSSFGFYRGYVACHPDLPTLVQLRYVAP